MFETKKELRETNESLVRQLEMERHSTELYRYNANYLDEQVQELEKENKRLKKALEKLCTCPACCKRREVEKPMTLGEFDKAMEDIARRYNLGFERCFEAKRREYKFTNPRIRNCSLCLHCNPHCGWTKIVIDVDDFAVCKSGLRGIENDIVKNCLG